MWLNWFRCKICIIILINTSSTIGHSCQMRDFTGAAELNQHMHLIKQCKIPRCTLTNVLSWESWWFYSELVIISNGRQSALGPVVHSNFQTIWKSSIYFLFQIYISQQTSREEILHLTMFYGPGLACLSCYVVSVIHFSWIIAASGAAWSQRGPFRTFKSSLTFARYYPFAPWTISAMIIY